MISNLISRRSPSAVASATAGSCIAPTPTPVKTSQTCYHRNQQYSIVGLTNAAGTLVERYTYSAYGTLGIYAANGTVRSSSTYANRYTYTGREWDADLRLYHFRARWYDPTTGGFVTRDPLGYVDGMSLYRGYFGVRGVDPSGEMVRDDWPKPDEKAGGTLVGFTKTGEGIFQSRLGYCYVVRGGQLTEVRCPGVGGWTDQNDPKIATGAQAILDGLKDLQKACDCCDGICKQCSIEECKAEAAYLTLAIYLAWNSNYGTGPHVGHTDPVAGWYCWDWAWFFYASMKRQNPRCFNIELDWAKAHVPNADGLWGYHAYVRVSACSTQRETDCLVTYDDGFFEDGFVHPGRWPTRNDYEDQDGWTPENHPLDDDGIIPPTIPRK